MKLDIRQKPNKTSLLKLWFTDAFRKIRMVYTKEQISDEDLKKYLLNEWNKRYNPEGRFHNNVTQLNKHMTVTDFIDMFINDDDLILTGYACLYKSQEKQTSMSIEGIKELLRLRKIYKNKMLEYTEGTYWYTKYEIDQLTYKRAANSQYGVAGQSSSVFYNSYIQNSITLSGRDLITTSISTMESFLSNSNKFKNIDDLLEFINNVKYEKHNYDILLYVDRPIGPTELTTYLLSRFNDSFKITSENMPLISNIVNNMSDDLRTRLFYKNQMMKLFNNTYFINKITELNISKVYETTTEKGDPYSDSEFREIVCEFALYNHIYYDRYNRSMYQQRNSVLVVDTDSNFLYLDKQIKGINKLIGDESEEAEFRTLNMLIDILTRAMIYIFETATAGFGIKPDYRPLINMKNEFKYKRLMTTSSKKSYAGMFDAKLGKKLPKPKLDMKGLQISKANSPKMLRDRFQALLINKVLLPKNINLLDVLDEFDNISNEIKESLLRGNVTYAIPQKVEVIESYKVPLSQMAIRGQTIWNHLEPNNTINAPDRCNIFELNCMSLDDPRLVELQRTHPDKYDAIKSVVFEDSFEYVDPSTNEKVKLRLSKFKFTKVAVPTSLDKIPDYLIPFIDLDAMVAKLVQNANIILKSLGVMCLSNKTSDTETRSTIGLL